MAQINPVAAKLFADDKKDEWVNVIESGNTQDAKETYKLFKVLETKGLKLQIEIQKENDRNMRCPLEEHPFLLRVDMLNKLYPVVKHKYD